MKITELLVNQLHNPVGYDFSLLHLSWKLEETSASHSQRVRVRVSTSEDMYQLILDTGEMNRYEKNWLDCNLELKPCQRYYWQVTVEMKNEECAQSEVAFFETGLLNQPWRGHFIATKEAQRMPEIYKEFSVDEKLKKATVYIYGVGLYELYANEEYILDEYLMPGYHSYNLVNEYQTFDITDQLKQGKNKLSVLLGEGWYKGRFGFEGGFTNTYGDQKKVIVNVHLEYESKDCWIATDESWMAKESPIFENNIYDGEKIDKTAESNPLEIEILDDHQMLLKERSNPPIKKVRTYEPVEIRQEKDYVLIDFGEMITGWVEFTQPMKMGEKLIVSYCELLQNKEFYNANLRTAKCQFSYVSDGKDKVIRPHFTYYGFRYIKVEGDISKEKIKCRAYRLMSDLSEIGNIETSNPKLNTLFQNTKRSQMCNFLDIPTDCPQRDERMGWTGDAAIFAPTACFHMQSENFFSHYLMLLKEEQKKLHGAVPFFVPTPPIQDRHPANPFYSTAGVSTWGDAATIIPMTLYDYYGNVELLKEHYPIMTAWVDYVGSMVAKNEVPYLWQNERQLGDWLALDAFEGSPIGKTDANMIASAFYYYSLSLCERAARVIGDERQKHWGEEKQKVKQAFIHYYFSENNELTVCETQTGCALLLYFNLYPNGAEKILISKLEELIKLKDLHLDTGFVGTPILCQVLSKYGKNELAYTLLLREDYPSWLYEVNLGATTIWERWNSLLEDGTISGTDMNSMNHYAYGSISNWMYRYMCGLKPSMGEDVKMTIEPMPDPRVNKVCAVFKSIYGNYVSGWCYDKDEVIYHIEVPCNANAHLIFTNGVERMLEAGVYYFDTEGGFIH